METQGEKLKIQKIIQTISDFLSVPWLEIINLAMTVSEKVSPLFKTKPQGLYEVINYETTLEIHDRQGKKATVNKRQKVRYLQNNIIAYQDQAWGDGEILIDYKCAPGVPVDQYRLDYKTILLISLREEKNKDDMDDFHIIWTMKNGFLKNTESWATAIQHNTNQVTVNVIFPSSRPPFQVTLIESKSRKTKVLADNTKKQLPDGRWQITWKRFKPKVYEEYLLEWKW